MSIEANRATALQFLEHLSDANFDAMFELMADDAIWRVAGNPVTFAAAGTQTKAERRQMFDGFVSIFRSLSLDIIGTTAEQDRVVVEFTAHGETHSGQTYDNEYLCLYRMRDGKIVSVYEHCDQQAVLGLGEGL